MLVAARSSIAGGATGQMLGPVRVTALSSGRPAGDEVRPFHGECGHRESDLLPAFGEAGIRVGDALIDQAMARDAGAIVAMRVRNIELAVGTIAVLAEGRAVKTAQVPEATPAVQETSTEAREPEDACRSIRPSAEGSSLHH